MARPFFIAAGILGLLGVAGGAFGAHALRGLIDPESLQTYEVAVRYQMYHVFALALSAWGLHHFHDGSFRRASWLFISGVALFSGSLYIVVFTGIRWFGAVTPFGGFSLLAGWAFLIIGFWKQK